MAGLEHEQAVQRLKILREAKPDSWLSLESSWRREEETTLRDRIESLEEELLTARMELKIERRLRNEAIREARKTGKSLSQIAKSFGVTREGVRYICNGRRRLSVAEQLQRMQTRQSVPFP